MTIGAYNPVVEHIQSKLIQMTQENFLATFNDIRRFAVRSGSRNFPANGKSRSQVEAALRSTGYVPLLKTDPDANLSDTLNDVYSRMSAWHDKDGWKTSISFMRYDTQAERYVEYQISLHGWRIMMSMFDSHRQCVSYNGDFTDHDQLFKEN